MAREASLSLSSNLWGCSNPVHTVPFMHVRHKDIHTIRRIVREGAAHWKARNLANLKISLSSAVRVTFVLGMVLEIPSLDDLKLYL
jgi:hypothetical protein